MADKPFRCRLITPDSRVFDRDIAYANVPLHDGMKGFMANAAAFVGRLGAGELRLEFVDRYDTGVKLEEMGNTRYYIEGGFVQIVGNVLTILATRATAADQLDPKTCRKELDEALAKTSTNAAEMDRITQARNNARAKLALAGTK
ncbi:MAG: F0F1 ATP synthase subunit epsilon [Phycisphaerales bacterium]|nr:F0F1 ATP synthase subunit epsilon [Phycisphaerales bacterium]